MMYNEMLAVGIPSDLAETILHGEIDPPERLSTGTAFARPKSRFAIIEEAGGEAYGPASDLKVGGESFVLVNGSGDDLASEDDNSQTTLGAGRARRVIRLSPNHALFVK